MPRLRTFLFPRLERLLSSLSWERRFKLRQSVSRSASPIPTALIVAGIALGAWVPRLEQTYFDDRFLAEHHLDLLDAAAARGARGPQERAAASVADANALGGSVALEETA